MIVLNVQKRFLSKSLPAIGITTNETCKFRVNLNITTETVPMYKIRL